MTFVLTTIYHFEFNEGKVKVSNLYIWVQTTVSSDPN